MKRRRRRRTLAAPAPMPQLMDYGDIHDDDFTTGLTFGLSFVAVIGLGLVVAYFLFRKRGEETQGVYGPLQQPQIIYLPAPQPVAYAPAPAPRVEPKYYNPSEGQY